MSEGPSAKWLQEASEPRVISWLREALRRLASDPPSKALPGTPLSVPVAVDALRTSCEIERSLEEALESWRALGPPEPLGRLLLVLPSNVETSGIRPLVLALIARNAVWVRPSSRRKGVLPRLIAHLEAVDPLLARAVRCVEFPREDPKWDELRPAVDAVHLFGSDEAAQALRGRGFRVIAHGSALSLAWVPRRVSSFEAMELAYDVARYDQRGCLSPQALIFEEGLEIKGFVESLHEALSVLDVRFPRGAMSLEERAEEQRFRLTSVAIGSHLYEGKGHALSIEAGHRLRSSPGLRNLLVYQMPRELFLSLVRHLGPRLKRVGTPREAVQGLKKELGEGVEVVAFGEMQRPGLLSRMEPSLWGGWVRSLAGR
ncbi:MAG: acyl-CoA reductase [Deltaproteobacteria bacterium]|nr:acyl-CoA reductase [Deltaproteobacteria bacterium]